MKHRPQFVCLLIMPEFKLSDPMPDGYLERSEWARTQMRAGRRQHHCKRCKLWHFTEAECKAK
jgi:hypothetical protein